MKPRLQMLFAVVGLAVFIAPLRANTVLDDDSTKIFALSKKVMEFQDDLVQINGSILRSVMNEPSPSQESRRTMLCMMRVEIQARLLDRALYGAYIATAMSSSAMSSYPSVTDEKFALELVGVTLSLASRLFGDARSELNAVYGGCGRQSQLAYDKAKLLMGLVEEGNKIIPPILRRVEAAR
jgi:hypothetical protein